MTSAEACAILAAWALWIEDPVAGYEAAAEQFFRATGMMAPSKSVPAEMAQDDHKARHEAWTIWIRQRTIERAASLWERRSTSPGSAVRLRMVSGT